MNFDAKSLMCFKKVAELEHMTKAAQELYISQAQLSRIIQDLENQFEVKFFDRVGNGIRLNTCGAAFYNYAQQILDLTTNMQKKAKDIYMHEISQATITTNCSTYAPGLLRDLQNSFPDLKFRHISVPYKKCVSLLKEGVTDFSISCPMIEDHDITTVFLRKEVGIVIYPEGHWLEGRERVSLAELAGEKMIGQSNGYAIRNSCDSCFQKYRFEANYVIETSETHLITRMVKNRLGIAILSKSMFSRDDDFKFRHCEIEEPIFGNVGLSWMKSRQLSDADRIFMTSIRSHFEKMNEDF